MSSVLLYQTDNTLSFYVEKSYGRNRDVGGTEFKEKLWEIFGGG